MSVNSFVLNQVVAKEELSCSENMTGRLEYVTFLPCYSRSKPIRLCISGGRKVVGTSTMESSLY